MFQGCMNFARMDNTESHGLKWDGSEFDEVNNTYDDMLVYITYLVSPYSVKHVC